MNTVHVEESAVINASPAAVYAVLADYVESHPAILPKPYFTSHVVERGGQGSGTVVTVQMNVFGAKRTYHLEVSEPQPGRVLVETDRALGVETSFTIEPYSGGSQTRLTIATDFRPSRGLAGWMERWMNPPIMRRIYRQEMQNLQAHLGQQAALKTGSVAG